METVFQRRLPGRLAIEIPIQGFKLFERSGLLAQTRVASTARHS
jgi:hypothetical protein